MSNIENGFVIFYAKEGKLYPVALSNDEYNLLQHVIPSVLDKPIRIIDKPQGEALNLKECSCTK